MKATSRKISPLAISVCSLFIVILLLSVGLDIYDTNELANLSHKIYEHPLTVSNAGKDIKIHINAMQRNMMDIVRAETPEQLNEAVEKVNANIGTDRKT